MDAVWNDEQKSRQFIEALDKRGVKLTDCRYSDTRVEWDTVLQYGDKFFICYVSNYEIEIKPSECIISDYPNYVKYWATFDIVEWPKEYADPIYLPMDTVIEKMLSVLEGRK